MKKMDKIITVLWFRQDLRLSDNPALLAAVSNGVVIPVYILDDHNSAAHKIGAAGRCWLHYSLIALNLSLNRQLLVYSGDPEKILNEIMKKYNANAINWNRCYEPWAMERDRKIKHNLSNQGISVNSFNGSLLWEPWEALKKDKSPYRVFTPFYYNACLQNPEPRIPLDKPKQIDYLFKEPQSISGAIEALKLLPGHTWGTEMISHWSIGEQEAQKKLKKFISELGGAYKAGRDFPSKNSVSRLSPHLHFGEVSPNQVWYAANGLDNNNVECFKRQIAWREFSYNLLYHNQQMPETNLQSKFNRFRWKNDEKIFNLWKKGKTGIPLIDAGMRELWQTGYIHNRVRMLVGSFLVKNLLIDWRYGERWFWDCLVDADLANNVVSWQWVAGTGTDAAPYYRIFNPITQGQKFDGAGVYTRKYVPELKNLPDKYLFNPSEAPRDILENAGVELGINYPFPIIDIKLSRELALKIFKSLGS